MKKTNVSENNFEKFDLAKLGVDKLDNVKKKRFIELYNQLFGHISNTCQATGISRALYYQWLEKDELFRSLIMESEMNLNDEIRDVLINKAASGDMTAVIFYLKKRHPDFKEQPTTLIQNNFGDHAKKELEEFEG
jgi:hypothetical protein